PRVVELNGEFATIRAALDGARTGTRIIVKAGTYEEELNMPTSVQLLGAGSDKVRVISRRDPCLRVNARNARVHGIGFTLDLYDGWKPAYAVEITKGAAILDSCDIISNSAASIVVAGTEANPTISNCNIHHGKSSGVYIRDGGQAVVENCEIIENGGSGIR